MAVVGLVNLSAAFMTMKAATRRGHVLLRAVDAGFREEGSLTIGEHDGNLAGGCPCRHHATEAMMRPDMAGASRVMAFRMWVRVPRMPPVTPTLRATIT